MKKLDLIQGSDEWLAARLKYLCASEAAAMLGLDKKTKRTELLRMKASGMEREFSQWVRENLLEKGHEIEEMARTIVEYRLFETLDQIVAISDDEMLLASFDGMTMMDDRTWENKMMNKELLAFITENNDLPDTHWPQCEHQSIVSDGAPVYFTVSDGTEEGTIGIWYESKPERREQVLAGWAQFVKDLSAYVPSDVKEIPRADVTIELPALFVHARGEITTNNMDEFGIALTESLSVVRSIVLLTDQDFSNAKDAAKKFRDTAKSIKLSKEQMLAQTETIGEAARKMDAWINDLNKTALQLEKDYEREDLIKKERMILGGKEAYAEHITSLEAEIKPIRLSVPAPNFAEAIKNKRNFASMQDAIDTMLANFKIKADAAAKDTREKLAWCKENADGFGHLFPDLQQIIAKPMEDFALTISTRVEKAKADESARLNAERERIRAEEQAKAKREAEERAAEEKRIADAKAAAELAEANRIAAEEIRKLDDERKAAALAEAEKLADEAKAVIPVVEQKQEVAATELAKPSSIASSKRESKVLDMRLQITELLNSMNAFQVADVLAYCQATKDREAIAA